MAAKRKSKVDPITLSVIRGILETTQREMTLALEKTARSSVVNLAHDYSTALFNAKPGNGDACLSSIAHAKKGTLSSNYALTCDVNVNTLRYYVDGANASCGSKTALIGYSCMFCLSPISGYLNRTAGRARCLSHGG